MTNISKKEQLRRTRISDSAKSSDARQAYYDRIRGVKRGPDSLETRAAKSASHRAKRDTKAWQILYGHALRQYRQEAELEQLLKTPRK